MDRFIYALIIFLASFLPVAAQTISTQMAETTCTANGYTWRDDRCFPVSPEMLGAWVYAGSYYEDSIGWDLSHSQYDTAHPELDLVIGLSIENGIVMLESGSGEETRASLVWVEGKSMEPGTGVSVLYSLAGAGALVAYVPSDQTATHEIFEKARAHEFTKTESDWLLVKSEDFGTHYFRRNNVRPYPVAEFRRPADNACYNMFFAPVFFDKCVDDPDQWRFSYLDQATPLDMAIRVAFQQQTGLGYSLCLRNDKECVFESELAASVKRVTASLPFMQTDLVPAQQFQMIDDRVRLRTVFAQAQATIRKDADARRDDVEAILDAFAITGTEVLAEGIAKDKNDAQKLRDLIGSLTVNAVCTVGGLTPTAGPAISIGCGSVSVVEAIVAFVDAEFEDLPEVARTPTAINAKRFYHQVIREDEIELIRKLDNLRDLTRSDAKLARLVAENGVDQFISKSQSQKDATNRAMWSMTLETLGFLVGQKSIYVASDPASVTRAASTECTFHDALTETTIATEHFLELKEGSHSTTETTGPRGAKLARFEDIFRRDRYRTVEWQIMIGRPIERRPLDTRHFDELARLISPKDLFEILKDRRYLDTNTQIEFSENIPKSNALTKTQYNLVVTDSKNFTGIFRLPAAPFESDWVLQGVAENPALEQVILGVGLWRDLNERYCFLNR